MKKILLSPILLSLIISCNSKKTNIDYTCVITSFKEEPKISIHEQMNRTRYVVTTSCGSRKFVVYRKYNIGDTIKLTEVVIGK